MSVPVLTAHASLLRWLGPWSSAAEYPNGVTRRSLDVPALRDGDRAFEAWVYMPARRAPIGAYLLCPGLHYLGPRDPRLDRFACILAASGILVLAPFLPDFLALRVDPRVVGDLERALALLLHLSDRPKRTKPGIFSISFGSLPTLRLAASPKFQADIGALVIFGGYADWAATIRFCLGAGAEHSNARRDPLNQPVVLMNLVEDIPGAPADPTPLVDAWRRYVESTWGRPEMKAREEYRRVGERIEADLPEAMRSLFRIGIGLDSGALELCESALAKQVARDAFLDPRPHLGGIRCPVHLCHGVDDDVIPHTELARLAGAMPPEARVETYLTGLYDHTGVTIWRGLLSRLPLLAREGRTLLRILRAIVRSARVP